MQKYGIFKVLLQLATVGQQFKIDVAITCKC